MNFKRSQTVTFFQNIVGCRDPDRWDSYLSKVLSATVHPNDTTMLQAAISMDAIDLYYKGLISLAEALTGIQANRFSWSIIKLYYSVYFFTRSSLLSHGHVIFRCAKYILYKFSHIPTIRDIPGKNDHEVVLNYQIHNFASSDILQSNMIANINSYLWVKEARNVTNYKSAKFSDPLPHDLFKGSLDLLIKCSFDELLSIYARDKYNYCFQEDHAILALPVKRLLHTRQDLVNAGLNIKLESDQYNHIAKMLPEILLILTEP
jgi:hypothetical protein